MRTSPVSVTFIVAVVLTFTINVHAINDVDQSLQSLIPSLQVITRPATSSLADRGGLKSAVLAGNFTPRPDSSRVPCPTSCNSAGVDPASWFVYSSVQRLERCSRPMLLNFALVNQLDDSNTRVKISACTADLTLASDVVDNPPNSTCLSSDVTQVQTTSTLQLGSSGSSSTAASADVVNALEQLKAYFSLSATGCNETVNFAMSGSTAVGVYVGSGLASQDIISAVLAHFSSQIHESGSVSEEVTIQMCDDILSRYSLGIVVNTQANLPLVQRAVQSFKNGSCVATTDTKPWRNITFLAPPLADRNNTRGNTTDPSPINVPSGISRRRLSARSDCKTVKVQSGDSCGSLAAECGITATEFSSYNPSSNLCSTLAAGEYVCCSAGTLPDNSPKPSDDGNCYSYLVQPTDSCSELAASYSITLSDIEEYNSNTWGWNGCSRLLAGEKICLSSGYSPMPANIPNAVCGPQVNDTATAPPGSDLSTMNKCPLNACCDAWGQCGTTAEFCTISNSTTGAPGTAAVGQNGCISNYGTSIITSSAPAEFISVAYFEGWDWQRSCLNMGVGDIDTSTYTHIHFAFATINPDWSLNISSIASQFDFFAGMRGVKRIISIGGWGFSTDPATYTIFRDVVNSEASRQTLVTNVVNFLNLYGLDGVDWDWEYSNEPDIPGIPAGSAADSTGFFLLLDELSNAMATKAPGKTVSITAPSSYWYLKEFPILALSSVVDYIVYMTYDMHGQWDYGNDFSDPGCAGNGGCLRSHVNMSETINAFSMITKAGVASNMIVAGLSSYGRSFEMSSVGCWTAECTFTGPLSGALAGECTDTPGYIANYELETIISSNPSAQSLWDEDSYSNILVYNSDQWVAYMNDSNKAVRKLLYQRLSLAGTADWAVDLQSETGDGDATLSGPSGSSGGGTAYIDPAIWSSASLLVTAVPGMTLIWPPMPLPSATTISFPLWTTTVEYSSLTTLTSTLSNGVTSTYPWYIYVSIFTTISIPAVTTTAVPVWAVTLTRNATGGPIYLTSSVQPPPFGITITPVINGSTSIFGPTQTSTSPASTIVWGDYTYIEPPQTETEGGTTTIIGGTTLGPTILTVTPNPHPTTVPSTIDPILNTRTPTWFSASTGSTPKPTSLPGCPGCGTPCILFCNPGCPFCPPGVMGGGDGSDDGDNDDDNSSTQTEASYTVYMGDDTGDEFPATMEPMSELLSLMSMNSDMWDGEWWFTASTSTSRTTTPTPTTVPTSVTPVATSSVAPQTPTPTADCNLWDQDIVAYEFEIFNIEGWVTDGGATLKKQEQGCGALTFWKWHDATATTGAYVYFNLPTIIKAGCVERAIVSAGGPKLSCQGKGVTGKRDEAGTMKARAIQLMTAEYLAPSEDELEILRATYANVTVVEPYVPMNWSTTVSNSSTSSIFSS